MQIWFELYRTRQEKRNHISYQGWFHCAGESWGIQKEGNLDIGDTMENEAMQEVTTNLKRKVYILWYKNKMPKWVSPYKEEIKAIGCTKFQITST